MSNSSDGTNYKSYDNASSKDVAAGTQLRDPGTGKTGTADGHGGVFVDK